MVMCDDGHDLCAYMVRVGVIDLDGHDMVAVSMADESPVTLIDRLTDEVAELLGWAKDERHLLADLRPQQDAEALKTSLNRAVLTNRQWPKVRHALDGDNPSDHDMTVARNALRDAAPADWTESGSDS